MVPIEPDKTVEIDAEKDTSLSNPDLNIEH